MILSAKKITKSFTSIGIRLYVFKDLSFENLNKVNHDPINNKNSNIDLNIKYECFQKAFYFAMICDWYEVIDKSFMSFFYSY